MNIESIIQISTLISIIFGIVWGITSYKKQMNAQVFLEYTKRFEEIMQSFPRNTWASRLNSGEALPESSDELSTSVLKYLNLCSEEYYLCKRGYLSNRIWRIWEAEIKRTLQTPLFKREWKKLSTEYESYPEFRSYVNDAQG